MRGGAVGGRAARICGVLLVTLLVLTAATASGAPRGGPAEAAGGRGPLTVVTGRDLTGYLHEVLADWNRARPAERVELVELPEAADEVHAQLRDSLRSGSARYDVLNIDVAWTAEFAGNGWIAPVDGARVPDSALLPSVLDTVTYRGRRYAVPYVTNAALLYYRKDVLDREGLEPPRTWDELARQASTLSRKYRMHGYAGQLLPYEGLTVNVTEAIQSAGGSLTGPDGEVTVDTPAALAGLRFLTEGLRAGWIPEAALGYKEESSRQAFQAGELLFLRNWPYVHTLSSAPGSPVAGKVGVVPLPGRHGAGQGVLGGSNLAVNARSPHPRSAADLLTYLLSEDVQRRVLTEGALPPVRASLYTDPALVRRYPYLPVLARSVAASRVRMKSARYEQVSLAIAAVTHGALTGRVAPEDALRRLDREVRDILLK
ncbi:ABC transporter substrate-binding protein [Streptomyces sp. NPDC059578]|uniref:ABC transporter substrate-binding protein n=1 Tax=unclassified Streptomyces TaxID=2593676 RepID=UPI00365F08F0